MLLLLAAPINTLRDTSNLVIPCCWSLISFSLLHFSMWGGIHPLHSHQPNFISIQSPPHCAPFYWPIWSPQPFTASGLFHYTCKSRFLSIVFDKKVILRKMKSLRNKTQNSVWFQWLWFPRWKLKTQKNYSS